MPEDGLRHIMPRHGAETNKGDETKGQAETGQGKGSEAVEKAGGGYIIVIMKAHDNYNSSRHTRSLSPSAGDRHYKWLKFSSFS